MSTSTLTNVGVGSMSTSELSSVSVSCAFCISPASPASSEPFDFVTLKFLYHYFQVPFKAQTLPNGTFVVPVLPLCSGCAYILKEVQRLASIWVELQEHLFENIVPEIQHRFAVKDAQLLQRRSENKDVGGISKESTVSATFKEHVLRVSGFLPDALIEKKEAERIGQFVPVNVRKRPSADFVEPPATASLTSLPEVEIESLEWKRRHPLICSDSNTVKIVTLVYTPEGVGQNAERIASATATVVPEPSIIAAQRIEHDGPFAPGVKVPVEISCGEGRKKQIPKKDNPTKISDKKKKYKKSWRTEVERRQIQCKFCPLIVFYPHTYRKHEQKIHRSSLNYKCTLCKEIFSSEIFLAAHSEIHKTDVKEWVCSVCDKKYFQPKRLRKHIQDVHIPNYVEGSTVARNNHKLMETEPKHLQCLDCGSQFSARKQLVKHMNTHTKKASAEESNLNELEERCNICDKSFPRDILLARHELTHPELLSYECTETDCKKKFTRRPFLDTHFKTHGVGPFTCILCPETLPSADALGNHLAKEHTGESLHRCKDCSLVFAHRSTLLYHRAKLHGGRTYPCKVCKKIFHKNESLKLHLELHHPLEVPQPLAKHQCPICSKCFLRGTILNVHIRRTHEKDKESLQEKNANKQGTKKGKLGRSKLSFPQMDSETRKSPRKAKEAKSPNEKQESQTSIEETSESKDNTQVRLVLADSPTLRSPKKAIIDAEAVDKASPPCTKKTKISSISTNDSHEIMRRSSRNRNSAILEFSE